MKPSRASIVYCVDREALGTVFFSQVLKPLLKIASDEFPIHVLAFCPLGEFIKPQQRRQWRRLVALALPNPHLKLHRLPTSAGGWRSGRVDQTVLALWLRLHSLNPATTVLHCRNTPMTATALRVKRSKPEYKVIYDSRCMESEEFKHRYRRRQHLRLRRYRQVLTQMQAEEHQALQEADTVLCVSDAMRGLYQNTFGTRSERLQVIPCSVDIEQAGHQVSLRDSMRATLGLVGKQVYAFSGSAAEYQCIEETLSLFRGLAAINPDAHLLVLTPEVKKMLPVIAGKAPFGRYSVATAAPNQVFSYLAAADIGLLLRENLRLNHIASPVKFGEYLACGVPVLLTPYVGDFAEWVNELECGFIVDSKTMTTPSAELVAFTQSVIRERTRFAERCRAVAQARLDLRQATDRLRVLYRALKQDAPV